MAAKAHRRKIRTYANRLRRRTFRKFRRIYKRNSKRAQRNPKVLKWEKTYIFNPRVQTAGGISNSDSAAICNLYPSCSISNNNMPGIPINA